MKRLDEYLVKDIYSEKDFASLSDLEDKQILYKDTKDRVSVAFLYGNADKFKVSNSLFDTTLKMSLEKTLNFVKRYYSGPNINNVVIMVHKHKDKTSSSNYILDGQEMLETIYSSSKDVKLTDVSFSEFIKYYDKHF